MSALGSEADISPLNHDVALRLKADTRYALWDRFRAGPCRIDPRRTSPQENPKNRSAPMI